MFRPQSRSRLKIRSLVLCLATLLLCASLAGCGQKTVTGNEWLMIQKQCLEDLQAFANGMDEVYSLYILTAIGEDDFMTEHKILKQQYTALLAFYDQLKEENPVKEGSHSYVSKRGTEGIEDCYKILGEILENSFDENGRPLHIAEMTYRYMAYKQNLSTAISTYVTAVLWLEEANANNTTPATTPSTT